MRKIVGLNLLIFVVYFISYFLFKINFPYFIYFVGLIFYFLPGINYALFCEQISTSPQGKSKIFLWALGISLVLTPAFIYVTSLFKGQLADEKTTFLFFIIWWFTSLLTFFVPCLIKKVKPTTISPPSYKDNKIFWWAVGIFMGVMVISFIIYPFIPEADPYRYLLDLRLLSTLHQLPAGESRQLFLALLWTVSYISKLSFYWLFKVFIPLLGAAYVIIFYQISRRLFKNHWLLLLSSLSFLLFPVIVLELLIPRAQSVFMIIILSFLYLLTNLLSEKRSFNNLCWFLLALIISILGMKIHQFFGFLTLTTLIAIVVFLWPQVKKYPFQALLSLILIFFGAYPWFRDLGFLSQITDLARPFWDSLFHPKIDLWFIDNYTNVDGNQMGWQGYTWLFYYGYNLGFFLPILLAVVFIKKIRVRLKFKKYWPYLLSFLTFFLIAEIFPRLGLAFLPDRAWLFTSLFIALFIPLILKNLEGKFTKRTIIFGTITLLLISFTVSWGIIYAKQGWTSKKEYEAIKYINSFFPKESIIIGQGGSKTPIEYFTEHLVVVPDKDFFLSKSIDSSLSFIQNKLPQLADPARREEAQKKLLSESLRKDREEILNSPRGPERDILIKRISDQIRQFNTEYRPLEDTIGIIDYEKATIYILYSKDKFKNLYGMRAWWKDYNFYDADLKKFDTNKSFEKVYDKDDVTIWKYIK